MSIMKLRPRFQHRLSVFYKLMKLYGFGNWNPNKTGEESKLYNLYTCVLMTIMLVEASFVLYGTILEKDLNVKIYGMAVICTHFLFVLKYWSLVRNRGRMKAVVGVIEKRCFEFTRKTKFAEEATLEVCRVLRNYGLMSNVSILGYVYVTFNRGRAGSGQGWQLLPMYIPFDFQINDDGFFVIQSIINVFILLNGYYHVMMDVMISAVFIHVGAQFKAVAHCFAAVKFDRHKSREENQRQACEDLIKAIEYHNIVLKCTVDLQETLAYWFMAQIIESSAPLCLTLWLLDTSVGSTSSFYLDQTSHFMFMSFLLYQLFILTRYADHVTHQVCASTARVPTKVNAWLDDHGLAFAKVKTEALGVVDGVWRSGWYRYSPRTRTNMLQVLLRSTKPVRFSALGIVEINIDTFLAVVKNAYAFFTLLKGSNVTV